MSEFLISQVMTKSPVCVDASSSIDAALALMKEKKFNHIPVVQKGKPKGVVSMRDLELTLSFYGSLGTRGGVSVDDIDNKTESLLCVNPNETLKSVAKQMAEKNVSAALVVEDEKVVGIFTSTDAFLWIAAH